MPNDWAVGLHPDLISRVQRVLTAMTALGLPMRVCQGLRTLAEQQALYAKGRTAPGPIVTHTDGIIHRSNHQAGADGLGRAVDCCFIGPDPFLDHDPMKAIKFAAYGHAGQAVGLTWGGTFTTLQDLDHLELPLVASRQ